MEYDRFFWFENNDYVIKKNQLYMCKNNAHIKCVDDEEYFNFFYQLLNKHVQSLNGYRGYLRSLSFAVQMHTDVFKQLGFFIEHFIDDSYDIEEHYARIWNMEKSFHFYANIDKKVYDAERDEFKYSKVSKINEKKYLDRRSDKLGSLEFELKAINAFRIPIQHSK